MSTPRAHIPLTALRDCEWSFGDASTGRLARLNPLRWSGPLPFEEAISNLEDVLSEGSRPILVKVPAGLFTAWEHFDTTQGALEFLRVVDPSNFFGVQFERQSEILSRQGRAADNVKVATEAKYAALEAVNVATEAKDAALEKARAALEKVQSYVICEWMFGDAGVKLGHLRVAKLNPMRWSGRIPLTVAIQQLQEVQRQNEVATRKIIVRVPPGDKSKEMRFGSCAEAVLYLEGFCPGEDCDAANLSHAAAEARLGDAETAVAESMKELDAARLTLAEAEESLESANTRAARAEQDLEMATTHAAQAVRKWQEFSTDYVDASL